MLLEKPQSISQIMADFALSMRLSDVPREHVEYGKMLLMDTIGVAMSCHDMPHAKAVSATIEELGAGTGCTLWGSDKQSRLPDAVLYNSCLIHGADYDDTHVAGIVHPSASVVATALTVAELVHATGEQTMEAIIMGWELCVRLALAAKGRFHDVGFHGTGIVAPFAAACVAARLMGLDKKTLVNALGICGSQAAGLQAFLHDGTWTKKIHPGWGAHSAVYALTLARNGFLGPAEVFEDSFGLWQTHCGSTDGLAEEMSDLGAIWHTPEIAFKLYPVCHMTHSFIECMFRIMREQCITAQNIEAIECRIETRCFQIVCTPEATKKRPETDYMMRFSLPYVVAIAAINGRVSPWEIDLDFAKNPEVMALMDRVTCVDDNSKHNPGHFPGWIALTTKDGRHFVCDQRYEPGTRQNPIRIEDVKEKFNNNILPFYTPQQISTISDVIQRFETLSSIGELLVCLRMD